MSCLVCTQQPWGVLAFDALKHELLGQPAEPWLLLPDLGRVMTTKQLLDAIQPPVLIEGEPAPEPPRYVFFLHWSNAVPRDVLDAATCVNFHCTPLPYGRGGHPIENMLLHGHTETVLTAHRMTTEVDAGPIYAQKGPLSLTGSKDEILARFIEPAAQLMAHIAIQNPPPVAQYGEIVKFKRLAPSEYADFWKLRSMERPE